MLRSALIMMHALVELSSALTRLSRAQPWTSTRWRQESTGLRTYLVTVESGLATLPSECRPWLAGDDEAIQLGIACAEISEPLRNVKTSLDYLNGRDLSDGERARELNIFSRSSRELQRAISHLSEILDALSLPRTRPGCAQAYPEEMTSSHAAGVLPRIDIVIMVALPLEEQAAARALGDCSSCNWRGRRLHVGDLNGLSILVFPMDGMGNVGSAEATTRIIATWKPRYVMLTGIAGGVRNASGNICLGDVLVPDQVVGYELGKTRADGPERRYEVYRAHPGLLGAARGLLPQDWAMKIAIPRPGGQSNRVIPQAHFGPILAGEKVLADGATLADLRSDWPKAIGVEMEGLGVAVACYRSSIGFLAAKAVCDFADTAKDDDWQPYAAETAARFLIAVLANFSSQSESEKPEAPQVVKVPDFRGEVKVEFCRRIGKGWKELADLFDVSPHEREGFSPGDEPRDLWEWLERRSKLDALPDKLMEIRRSDLAEIMRLPAP
jgi:nucleoside phosphorylase